MLIPGTAANLGFLSLPLARLSWLLGNASFADAGPVVANCRTVPTALKNGPIFGMSGMI